VKVSYLHIRNYKQFSDLELNLTYPKGHPKAGKPLDKICIIGQSGTGKTNLLDIIKKSTIDFFKQPKNSYLPFSEFVGNDTDDRYISTKFRLEKKFNAETLFTSKTSKITFRTKLNKSKKYNILEHEKNYFVSTFKNKTLDENELNEVLEFDESQMNNMDKNLYDKLISAKAELVLESINENKPHYMESFNRLLGQESLYTVLANQKKTTNEKKSELNSAIYELEQKYTSVSKSIKQLERKNFRDKNIINVNEIDNSWKLLKEGIDSYEVDKTKYTKQLSSKLLNDDNYSKDDYKEAMALWEKENENILQKIATDINMIIKKFNLELYINDDTKSYEELIIKDLSNNAIIEYDDLSTGTKNLLSTFIPLKSHKPKDSVILIDEPEMSFYPNIQRQLTDLYMNVGKNNQLIMATHSPLIASSFEPWEVVELKFDKNNQIYREKYYEGDNHVDNYTVDPRMLTWTGILTDVFDLTEDSNFSFREKKLMEYATLKAEIKAMEDKNSKEAKEKIKQFKKLSALLGLQN
jgi:predicted ATPase